MIFFSLLPNFSRKKNLESRRLWLWISLDATRTGDIPPNSGTSRGLEKRLRVLQKKTAAGPFWYPKDIAKDERILPKPLTRGVPGVCAVRVCWNVFFVYWGLNGTFCPDHQLWLDFATAIFHLTHSMTFWRFPLKGPATNSRRWWKNAGFVLRSPSLIIVAQGFPMLHGLGTWDFSMEGKWHVNNPKCFRGDIHRGVWQGFRVKLH